MDKHVLLLNNSHEIVTVVPWQRAVQLLCASKASPVYGHDEFYRIPTSSGYYDLSSVIVLNRYVKVPYKKATLSRKNLLKRDDYKCQYCGTGLYEKNETIDHVIPTSKGGKHRWENVVACCRSCNAKKGDKLLGEIGFKLKINPYAPTKNYLSLKSIEAKKVNSWKKYIS